MNVPENLQSPGQSAIFDGMIGELHTTVSFTGHRTYGGEADALLRDTVRKLYARGMRTFLSGMAPGFDLAAAEAVLACRAECAELRLVAVIPFAGQELRFPEAERQRFRRIVAAADEAVTLARGYHRGCYAVRNNCLVDRAALLVAWYDGSAGGTQYTVRRALMRGREVWNLHPAARVSVQPVPRLF